MRVVSLNLDLDDAPVVRRALGDAQAACLCGGAAGGQPCEECEIRAALMGELDRLLRRPSPVRRASIGGVSALAAAFAPAPPGGPLVGPRVGTDRNVLQLVPDSLTDA